MTWTSIVVPHREWRALLVLVALVLSNYLVQIPYALHLYGSSVNGRGVLLLSITLVWFVTGVALLLRNRRAGLWLLLSYLIAEFLFYFRNEILLIPAGYGLPYHLTHLRDPLLWVAFLIGDLNFFAAGFFIWYLLSARARSRPRHEA
ncbi:MAG TPA: hypothetical protein VKY90_12045 [Candidatus Dormibacteraeota bacterium]|nr:hypothetical protein [Candidatus Dormibacteraeota bacterium]